MDNSIEKRPIIALDFPNIGDVRAFLTKFDPSEQLYLKVGMELYYAAGPDIIKYIKSLGHDVFLDLKLHDIPNTVNAVMKVIRQLEVSMTNVHAAGGIEMMEAALDGLAGEAKLIAVTQLTSTSEHQMQQWQGIKTSLLTSVLNYANNTQKAGLAGVVCSAYEVEMIKQSTSSDFICLTPGIRPAGSEKSDQKRVVTPNQARQKGSDFIVVGRPITQASRPEKVYLDIKKQWQ